MNNYPEERGGGGRIQGGGKREAFKLQEMAEMQLVRGDFQERRGKFGVEGSSLRFGDGVEEILPSQRRSIWRGAEERRDVGVSTPSCSLILLTLLILVLSMCFGRVSGTNVSPSRPSRAATAANAGGAGTRAVTGVQKAKRPKGHVKRFRADAPPSTMPADAPSCGPHRSLSPRVDHSLGTKGYPHEFGCSVCLDLAWKPVVLPCGHIFCFWCCHRSMDAVGTYPGGDSPHVGSAAGSKCPICRHPFQAFPKPCGALHGYLERTYSSEYARRRMEVDQEEVANGICSPEPAKSRVPSSISQYQVGASRQQERVPPVVLHAGAGCDVCGVMPIPGRRFKCLDCLGPVGWDVCEACYTTGDRQALASSGRFGQSPGHVPDHVIGEVPQDSLSRAIDGLRNVNSGRNSGPADRAQGDRMTCNATDIRELGQGTVPRVSLAGAAGEPGYTARNDTASIDFAESAARSPLDSPGLPSDAGSEPGRRKMRDVSWDGGHRLGSRSRAS